MDKLTHKEKKWADNYLSGKNQTESALNSYDTESENMAAVIGSKNIRKDKIEAYIEDRVKEAKEFIHWTMKNPKAKDETRLKAAQDIVDRAEGKATQRTQHSGNVTVNFNCDERGFNPKIQSEGLSEGSDDVGQEI